MHMRDVCLYCLTYTSHMSQNGFAIILLNTSIFNIVVVLNNVLERCISSILIMIIEWIHLLICQVCWWSVATDIIGILFSRRFIASTVRVMVWWECLLFHCCHHRSSVWVKAGILRKLTHDSRIRLLKFL